MTGPLDVREAAETMRRALETLTQDSLESSVSETLARPEGDQISDAFKVVIDALDALVAEVDLLTVERDEARLEWPASVRHFRQRAEAAEAEVARLRPLAEAMTRYFANETDWDGEMQALEDARAALAAAGAPTGEEKP